MSNSMPLAIRIASRSLEFHWPRRLDAPSGSTAVGLDARRARSAHHAAPRASGKTRPRSRRHPGTLRLMRWDRLSASRSWICRSRHVDRRDGRAGARRNILGRGAGWHGLRGVQGSQGLGRRACARASVGPLHLRFAWILAGSKKSADEMLQIEIRVCTKIPIMFAWPVDIILV